MHIIEDLAFIVNKQSYGDSDLIIHLFTKENGKRACFAPNARKSKRRVSTYLDHGNLLSVTLHQKPNSTFDKIYTTELKSIFESVRSNLDYFALDQYMIELVHKFIPPNSINENIFYLMICMYDLMEKKISPTALMTYFEFQLLQSLGFGISPETHSKINTSVSGLFSNTLFPSNVDSFDAVMFNNHRKVIDPYFQSILGKPIKSLSYLYQTLSMQPVL